MVVVDCRTAQNRKDRSNPTKTTETTQSFSEQTQLFSCFFLLQMLGTNDKDIPPNGGEKLLIDHGTIRKKSANKQIQVIGEFVQF